jgi:hypothetical protein
VTVSGPLTAGVITMRAGQRLTVKVREKEVVLKQVRPESEPHREAGAQGDEASDETGGAAETIAAEAPVRAADGPARPHARPRRVAVRGGPGHAPRAAARSDALERPAAARSVPPIAAAPPVASAPPVVVPAADAPANAGSSGDTRGTAEAPGGRVAPGGRSWTAALAAGDLDAVLDEAEQRGLARSLAEAGSDDLAALADAARYRKRDDVARQAMLAQRRRFPRSRRAQDAAFLLGRLEESADSADARARARALKWYDRYFDEAPTGAFASEALGRKMIAVEQLRGPEAARKVAEEYLRRFPEGTYAGAARALRDMP